MAKSEPGLMNRLRDQPVIGVLVALILVFCVCGAGVLLVRPLLTSWQKPQAVAPGVGVTSVPGGGGQVSAPDLTATAFFAPVLPATPPGGTEPQPQVTPGVEGVSPGQPPAGGAAPTQGSPAPGPTPQVPPQSPPLAPPQAVPPASGMGGGGSKQPGFKYRVQRGDNLWNIAWRFCGNPYAWTKIYADNRNKIPHYRLIYAGTRLRISCP